MAERKWIQEARKRMEEKGTVGALRRTAKRMGLIKGDEPLSARDLQRLERHAERTGNETLAKRVRFAQNVRKRGR